MYIYIYLWFFSVFLAGGGIFCGVLLFSLLRRGNKNRTKVGGQWNSPNLGSWIWTSFEHREPHSQDVPFCVHPCWGNATSHGHPGIHPQNQPGNQQVIPTVALASTTVAGPIICFWFLKGCCPESKAKPKCFQNRFHLNPQETCSNWTLKKLNLNWNVNWQSHEFTLYLFPWLMDFFLCHFFGHPSNSKMSKNRTDAPNFPRNSLINSGTCSTSWVFFSLKRGMDHRPEPCRGAPWYHHGCILIPWASWFKTSM